MVSVFEYCLPCILLSICTEMKGRGLEGER